MGSRPIVSIKIYCNTYLITIMDFLLDKVGVNFEVFSGSSTGRDNPILPPGIGHFLYSENERLRPWCT